MFWIGEPVCDGIGESLAERPGIGFTGVNRICVPGGCNKKPAHGDGREIIQYMVLVRHDLIATGGVGGGNCTAVLLKQYLVVDRIRDAGKMVLPELRLCARRKGCARKVPGLRSPAGIL